VDVENRSGIDGCLVSYCMLVFDSVSVCSGDPWVGRGVIFGVVSEVMVRVAGRQRWIIYDFC